MEHKCAGMFEEIMRMSSLGIHLELLISQNEDDEDGRPSVTHRMYDLHNGNKLIGGVTDIDIIFCPYCGTKLI